MGRKKSKLRRPKSSKKIPAPVATTSSAPPPPVPTSLAPPPPVPTTYSAPPPPVPTTSSVPPPPVPTSSDPPPPWIELPRDVTANILKRLNSIDLLENAQYVCKTWHSVCKDSSMWRVIDMKYSGNPTMMYDPVKMCRDAVNRSKGELIDIMIEDFGTDELLHYISIMSSQLRRLRIAHCDDISGKGLTKAVKNLPHLEELHLFFMSSSIKAGDIETIGLCCPMLKSFTFNDRGFKCSLETNEYPIAIAKSMPNLCHLRLFGNKMTTEGLPAILDGCPHLESLDLRQCFNVSLSGEIGKRCSQQIKSLKSPFDSTSDYEWDADIYEDEGDYYSNLSDYSYPLPYFGFYEDYTHPCGGEYHFAYEFL